LRKGATNKKAIGWVGHFYLNRYFVNYTFSKEL
jgi:hypothetical protein